MLFMEHVLDVVSIAETQFLDEREWTLVGKKQGCIDSLVRSRVESLISMYAPLHDRYSDAHRIVACFRALQ